MTPELARAVSPVALTAPGRYQLITLGRLVLVRPDGAAEPSLAVGSRKLALLTYLALAGRPLTRDHLTEVFWGDREELRARHSLRDGLSHLRRILGPESIPAGGEAVSLAAVTPLAVDALELVSAARAGDHGRVLSLARGAFLDGIHVPGSSRFEDWLARERAALDRCMAQACAAECVRLEHAHAAAAWAEAAARWVEISPLEPAALLALLRARAAPGTRAALGRALAEYQRISGHLAREYDATPDAEVRRFAASLAARLPMAAVPPESAAPADERRAPADPGPTKDDAGVSAPSASPVPPPGARATLLEPVQPRRAPEHRAAVALTLVAVAVLASWAAITGWRRAAQRSPVPERPLVSITAVQSLDGDTADAWLESGVPEMLAMGLSRAGTDVIAPPRVRGGRSRAPGAPGTALSTGAELALAGRLGATWQIDGGITHGPDRYVLDLHVRSVRRGMLRANVTVTAPDLISVVDQATARLVAALDAPAAGPRLEDVETGSVDAYRSFVAGLQLRSEGRAEDARRAFDAAIAADSNFVSAVVERLLIPGGNPVAAQRVRRLYARLHDGAPQFDRLALQTLDAFYGGDAPQSEALARRLVARFPRDPRSYEYLDLILSLHGRFREATRALRARLALDSLASAGGEPCGLCTSYAELATEYLVQGDLPGAERVARRGVQLQPLNATNWADLAQILVAQGRYPAALQAQARAAELAPTEPATAADVVRRQIEARQYAAADRTIRRWRLAAGPEYEDVTTDLQATLLREEGRYREAAAVLERYLARDTAAYAMALLLGHTLAASGQAEAAERILETRSASHPWLLPDAADRFAGEAARAFAWPHALLADALYLAASRDTARLAALADSIQVIGARSYFARDWTLYHHVRGLIAMRASRWAEAERELTAARFSRVGWTRTLAELARAELHLGKAAAALNTLRDAYQATLDGSGRYATRSELDLLMVQAFAAVGQRDSAVTYARYLRAAWAGADAPIKARLRELPDDLPAPATPSPAGAR